MKIIVVFLFALVAIAAATEEEDQAFEEYLKNRNIRLPRSGPQVEEKKQNFLKNRQLVEKHNKENNAYQLELNDLAILSYEEVIALKTGLLEPQGKGNFSLPAPPPDNRRGRATAPASWDWTTVAGVVRPVQNQGSCGSCWAFAAVGAIEGQLKLKYGRTDKISEQEVVECARNPWTGALLGCRGGWDFSAYNHAKDRNGITYASTRPYRGVDYTGCTTANARVPGSRVSYYYDINQDEEWMKHYLFNNGPLYVSFYVSNDFYSYRNGIYTDSRRFCGTQYNNHAVLLVGYGTENGLNYWKLKNSWGTNWGENGFFRLRRGAKLCGIHKDASYVVLA